MACAIGAFLLLFCRKDHSFKAGLNLMKSFSFALILSGVAVLTLAACDHQPPSSKKQLEASQAHYWQRASATSATWQRGPKAQQMLHRDISRCTAEIKELQRLGSIRAQIPANAGADGRIPNPATAEGRLAQWDTPERDGYLYAEHADYHDFETCMQFAGWERVEHLPYRIADQARDTYVDTILTEGRRSRSGDRTVVEQPKGPYDNLNQ